MIGLTCFYFFGLSTRINAYTQDESSLGKYDKVFLFIVFTLSSFAPYMVYTCVIRGYIREQHQIYKSV